MKFSLFCLSIESPVNKFLCIKSEPNIWRSSFEWTCVQEVFVKIQSNWFVTPNGFTDILTLWFVCTVGIDFRAVINDASFSFSEVSMSVNVDLLSCLNHK